MGFLVIGIVIFSLFFTAWIFPWVQTVLLYVIPSVVEKDPGGVLARLSMLVILLLILKIYPRLKLPGMKFGKPSKKRLYVFLYGMGIGSVTVVSYYIIRILLGQGTMEWQWLFGGNFLRTLVWYLLGAVAIGLLEESFFRGVVYNAFRYDRRTKQFAAVLASAFFGSMHWVDFDWLLRWGEGRESLFLTLARMQYLNAYHLGLFALISALGLLLIYIYNQADSLYASVGFHAGLVFVSRICHKIAVAAPGHSMKILAVSPENAPYLLLAMAIAAILIHRYKLTFAGRISHKF
ncbi:caax protease self-immunity [Lucifera butyrica]|uniref:Caax protease self-immunity n=1 Tax=Lucifera butyrica TaxID=1351585 RepID=A0A498RE71_9FIRM|nr:CPBP family intramembrane glutamic endopeptidase [Lucifera butyrica]VBB09295.1 caax protease self-immunity [Lucifera butyrica]